MFQLPPQTLSQLKCCHTLINDICCDQLIEPCHDSIPKIHSEEIIAKTNENYFLTVDNIKSENDLTDDNLTEIQEQDFLQKYVLTDECKRTIKSESKDTKTHRKRRKYSVSKIAKKLKSEEECNVKSNKDKSVLIENYTVIYMDDEELKLKRESDKQSKRFRGRCKYKCEFCISWFVDQSKYDRHMTSRHSEVRS